MVQSLIFFLVLSGGILMGWLFPWASVHGASALETVIAQCRQRTGFGESTCKTLVKKYMNVERCREYTGYSVAECTQKIEEIQRDPDFSSGEVPSSPKPSPVTHTSEPALSNLPPILPRANATLAGLREKKERDMSVLWQRTEAMIALLKDRGIETQLIEAALPELKNRSAELLSAYDTYRAAYEGTVQDSAATQKPVRRAARERVVQSSRRLVEYYQQSILQPLRVAYEKSL